jgi:hypothetical protein
MAELRRTLTPDGHLLFSTHGESYRLELGRAEGERFGRGELIVTGDDEAGSNRRKAS